MSRRWRDLLWDFTYLCWNLTIYGSSIVAISTGPMTASAPPSAMSPVIPTSGRIAASTASSGNWPEVLLAAKTYGSVFYDKSSPFDSSGGVVVVPVRNHVGDKRGRSA